MKLSFRGFHILTRILITGITGFVGYYLSQFLTTQNDLEIYGTRINEEDLFPVEDFDAPEMINLRIMDITIQEQVSTVLNEVRPDIIFHLAAQSNVAISFKEPQLTFNVNALGTLNLYDSIKKLNLDPTIIAVGSAAEYGMITESDLPINEKTPLHPMDPYGASKVSMYFLSRLFYEVFNLKIIYTRAFNHFGPHQKPSFAIPSFCQQIAEIEQGQRPPIINVGNLETVRDYLDVRDVVQAYWILAQRGLPGEIYNIASGNGQKMSIILNFLLSLAQIPITIKMDLEKYRPSDIPTIYGDSTKIQKETGWHPSININQTLEDTLNFWRNII